MDPTTSIPVKKQRITSANKSSNFKISECIREFELPQAYPSMVNYQKSTRGDMTMKKISLLPPPSSIISQKKNVKSTTQLHELKLELSNGSNSGEYNASILPLADVNSCENEKISLSRNNSLRLNGMMLNINPNPVQLNTMLQPPLKDSSNGKNSLLTSVRKQSKPNVLFMLGRQGKSGNSDLLLNTSHPMSSSKSIQDQSRTVTENYENDDIFVVQPDSNWQIRELCGNEDEDARKMTIASMRSPCDNEIGGDTKKIDSLCDGGMKKEVIEKSMVFRTIYNADLKTLRIINHGHNQFRESCVDSVNESVVRICGTKRTSSVSLFRPSHKEKKMINPMDIGSVAMRIGNRDHNDHCESKTNVAHSTCECHEDLLHHERQTDVANRDIIPRQSFPLRNSHGTVNLIRRGRKHSLPTVQPRINMRNSIKSAKNNNTSVVNSTNSLTSSDVLHTSINPFNDDVSTRLGIVGKALSMISDDELRSKALQALIDCGIGIERFVPVKPSSDRMSIRESQTQTSVFGLLDSSDFVHVTDSFNQLQETERHIIVDNTNIPNKPHHKAEVLVQELNKIFEQRWVNKRSVEQVKQILKVHPLVEHTYHLMKVDFENVKKYDENGLLSFHRAIISDQMHVVRRQLMVLQSCKESVDMPTLIGETGLELGIRNSVSPGIINLLLRSGANPAAGSAAHNSALTMAASGSSYFLPQLIKYVMKSADLNNVDSEGFTALHHCVRNNNIGGIIALIRANANLNVRDSKSGRTPLFYAVENDSIIIAKQLLANGAKANIPNFSGQTVFALLDDERHFSLKDVLNKSVK